MSQKRKTGKLGARPNFCEEVAGDLEIGNRSVSDYTDQELHEWLLQFGMNQPRQDALIIWAGIIRAFDEIGTPMTVRQMFYALTTRGYVPKTEKGYRQVGYRLLQMRRLQIIPYGFIADNTRWMRKPATYSSLTDFLRHSQQAYRRALWVDQDAYVEVWIEKDALAGVVSSVTSKWDVPLMVTRGFPSETFVYEAVQNIRERGKPTFLYYFGDYDPSGVSISDNLANKLSGGLDEGMTFKRVAVTADQIKSMKLPTRPTKHSDARAKSWQGDSVELDAIPANVLRRMVENCITRHIDRAELERIERIEARERETLAAVVGAIGTMHFTN